MQYDPLPSWKESIPAFSPPLPSFSLPFLSFRGNQAFLFCSAWAINFFRLLRAVGFAIDCCETSSLKLRGLKQAYFILQILWLRPGDISLIVLAQGLS
jgi:hypothetical protein